MVRYRRLFVLPIDLVLVMLAHFLAFTVRFEGHIPPDQWARLWPSLAVGLVVKPIVFSYAGFYRRLWRYASIPDVIHIVKTVFVASVLATLCRVSILEFQGYPRSVSVLNWIFLTILILGRSLAWRLSYEHRYKKRTLRGPPVLIVGAGMAGRMLFQEIRNNHALNYSVVGFLDDDPGKGGGEINGRPILGTIDVLPEVAKKRGVKKVIIAIPSAPSKLIRRVVQIANAANLDVQTLPSITDMLDSKALATQIRDVDLNDLLGRDPVRLDVQKIEAYLTGKRILVTGAGGSIGSEICRQVARFRPSALILLDVAETPLHHVSLEMLRDHSDVRTEAALADVRDREQIFRVFEEVRPEVVFHAAAYKHVPMMEYHPREAIKTNVFGTRNLAEAADSVGTARFVMVSTDKAVNPTNVMGASKRAAECYVQAFDAVSTTDFITVRFGNVLGSNGSVVPLFQEQIRRGGPVTVTDPEVVRYFMTIPEASQLVLQAGAMGGGGEIFLLDMGEPVKIVFLAEELIRLSGLQPHEDIEIVFTGLRPGEKLYEELLIAGEGVKPTEHKKIRVAAARDIAFDVVQRHLEEFALCLRSGDEDLLIEKLREVVPGYRPQGRVASRRRGAVEADAVEPVVN